MPAPSLPQPPAPPPDDPLAGTPYRVLAKLGEGGMGEVLEAEHETLGHRVAVKLLHAHYFARFELKERMRLEAQACARVRHENLVAVHDFGETLDGRAFLVMDRLHGRSLADELEARQFLPVPEALDLTRQALSGLAAAHAAGLVHRDLKPDNLFLCATPSPPRRLKVLDFGIAKIVAHAATPLTPAPLAQPTADGMTVGTPRWSSPEQSRGEPDLDARSDVYAMGWVLHAMLTGQPPFPTLTAHADLYTAHATQTPPLPSTIAPQPIPAALDALVRKALAKRREDRFPTAEAFRTALDSLAPQQAPSISPAPPAPSAPAATPVSATRPHPTLIATVEQGPLLPPSLPAHTVAASEMAIARPALPWSQGDRISQPQIGPQGGPTVSRVRTPAASRSRRPGSVAPVPVWFVVVVLLGVGATLAAAAAYVWGVAG